MILHRRRAAKRDRLSRTISDTYRSQSQGAPMNREDAWKILRERGVPEDIVYAVLCHADYLGLERKAPMDRAIYAVDELTGFITAVALVRPGKSIDEVDVAAVRKKMKDKGFARNVNRDDITNGAEQLGVNLDEHIAFVIESLKPVASQLGIAGSANTG